MTANAIGRVKSGAGLGAGGGAGVGIGAGAGLGASCRSARFKSASSSPAV